MRPHRELLARGFEPALSGSFLATQAAVLLGHELQGPEFESYLSLSLATLPGDSQLAPQSFSVLTHKMTRENPLSQQRCVTPRR